MKFPVHLDYTVTQAFEAIVTIEASSGAEALEIARRLRKADIPWKPQPPTRSSVIPCLASNQDEARRLRRLAQTFADKRRRGELAK